MSALSWVGNTMPRDKNGNLQLMSSEEVLKAVTFHRSMPSYAPTPLRSLKCAAADIGVGSIHIKDESYRFGLNAFKVLGASYAIARYIGELLGKDGVLTFDELASSKARTAYDGTTFFTATDGNHGRGVAFMAQALGQKAIVRMPSGTVEARRRNIEKHGAQVSIEQCNYDDCVRLVSRQAQQVQKGVVVQDTAWDGYENIPTNIMQGYGTMVYECTEQLKQPPTHVIVQAGVGSLAAAVVGFLAQFYADAPPKFIVVEAQNAACLYKSAVQGTGQALSCTGDMPTIMAGLCCGEANPIAWEILRCHVDVFVSAQDEVTLCGMETLARPLGDDLPVTSGESGAVGMGVLRYIMREQTYKELRQVLKLDGNSRVLLFSTEGDTGK